MYVRDFIFFAEHMGLSWAKYRVYIYLIATILLWSATPSVAKIALGEIDNYQLLFYTSIVALISLFIVTFVQGKAKMILLYTRNDYMKIFGMGILGIFFYYILLYKSFSLAPAGQVNVINYLRPVWIIIFSIPLLQEKYNIKTIVAVLISFIGALLAFTQGNLLAFTNEYALGYIFAACAAVCYGLFSVLGKKHAYETFSSMFLYYASATALIIPTSLYVSGFIIPTDRKTIASILVLGGIMNSVAFVFRFKALAAGNTHKIANTIYIVPFLAMIWTYVLNDEPFVPYSIIGLGCIVIGIYIQLKNKL